jgi:hypothetical protein
MKKIYLGLWAGICAVSPLVAQDDDDGKKPAKGRVAWFVYTSMPEGLENPVSVMSGKDVTEMTLSKRSPSQPVKIPADGILRIVRKVENPENPATPSYLTLAQANIAEGVSKALIILIPVEPNPKGQVFQAKVQDLAAFKGGDWLYLNMTKLRVGVDMGRTSIEIKPGEARIYNSPPLPEPVNVAIRYNYYHPVKEQWKMLSASTIALYPTRREICIFSWDPHYERIQKHGITFPVM